MHLLPHCKLVLLKLLLNFLSSALEDGATPYMQDLHTKCFSRIFIFGNIFFQILNILLAQFPMRKVLILKQKLEDGEYGATPCMQDLHTKCFTVLHPQQLVAE